MKVRTAEPPKYLLRLSSVPNEQYLAFGSEAERLEEGYKNIRAHWVKVPSLKVARNTVRRFKDENDLGMSNWTGGQIFSKEGVKVGNFSCNGKFWRRDHPLETISNKIKHAPSALLNELY